MSETPTTTRKAEGPEASYRSAFDQFTRALNGDGGPERLAEARLRAIDRFTELGFPTRKVEDWKYTDVSPIARGGFLPADDQQPSPVTRQDVEGFLIPELDGPVLVFVNGRYSEDLSRSEDLPDGVRLGSLARALEADDSPAGVHAAAYASFDEDAFTALNTAFLRDGAYLHVPAGVALEAPVQVLFLAAPGETGTLTSPRNLYVVDAQGSAQVVETWAAVGSGSYFNNTVTEAVLGEEARLVHCKIGEESDHAFHVGTTQAHQAARSRYHNVAVTFGGAIVRNNVRTWMDDEDVVARLDGVYYASDEQLVDNYTSIDHAKPNCNSYELYKGILGGRSTGVFNGRIYVHQDAQKTDAKQSNSGLLLSEDATLNSKPQLEIFADDVKCTHGATVGFLDKDALFYLQSRGFSRARAEDTLTYAFANEVLERIPIEAVRHRLGERLTRAVTRRRARTPSPGPAGPSSDDAGRAS